MFNKITCKKCNKKVSKRNSFCPNCGNYVSPYKKPKENYGMLGAPDSDEENELMGEANEMANSIFGGFGGKMLNKVLNQTMKMLEKEMQKSMQESMKNTNNQNPERGINNPHFELFINGKRINPENIKVTQKPIQFTEKTKVKKSENKNRFFSGENIKKFSNLPKEEPKTDLRRLPDKIIYEIIIPGVNSIEDISIIKLENSIEIKAVSKNKAYSKVIPINLEIVNYEIQKGKLILELTE